MNVFRRITFIILAIITISMPLSASSPRRPDFAFPKTVAKDSEKALAQALKRGDDVAALRAALNLTLAMNAIDSDSMASSLKRLVALADGFSKPAPRAVADLLIARIYADYYRSQNWTIDRRKVAGDPDDMTEWDRSQFKARVTELLNSAMASPETLLATPLRNYDSLLDIPSSKASIEYMFFPSLLDFVGGQAIDILSDFRTDDTRALADEYRQTLIRLNASHPAPLIVNEIIAAISGAGDDNQVNAALLDIYERHQSTAFCGEALITYAQNINVRDIGQATLLKALIDGFIERYPTYVRINHLKNRLADILAKSAAVTVPDIVVPGDYIKVRAEIYNLPSLKVGIYRLPQSASATDSYRLTSGIVTSALRKVGELNFAFTGEAPFKGEATDSLRIAEPGLYIAIPEAPGLSRDSYYDIIHCTDLMAAQMSGAGENFAVVVNPLTGSPQSGSDILFKGYSSKTEDRIATTDTDGMAKINGIKNGYIRPVKGSDIFAKAMNVRSFNGLPDTTRNYRIEIYTDLPLYHPGDTVSFAAIAYSVKERQARAERGLTINVILRDANYQSIDTIALTTDSYGRVSGSFTLPDDGRLNGYYQIQAVSSPAYGNASFMVSDYKLPSFEVKITDTENDVPSRGDVTLRGVAKTYSGMPVADGKVEVTIERSYLWRVFFDDSSSWSPVNLSATTDAEGRWSVVVPAADLSKGGEGAWFNAAVTVTSPAGESQAASRTFTLGRGIRIDARLKDNYDISRPFRLPVSVLDTRDNTIDSVMVDYIISLAGKGSEVMRGSFSSGNPVVDWSSLSPGSYNIAFTTADADTVRCFGLTLYNPAINRSPSDNLIWTPDSRVTLGADNSARILLGTVMDTTHVLYTLYDYEKIIERRWLTLPAGLHSIDVETTHGGEPDLRASFIAAGRYESCRINVDIKPSLDPRGLTIKAEAMRDLLVPGAEETWKFSVVNATGTAVEAAVMTDMFNGALNALANGLWGKPNIDFGKISLHWNINTGNTIYTNMYTMGTKRLDQVNYSLPDWQLYGRSLMPQTFRNYLSSMNRAMPMMKSAARVEMMSDDAVEVVEEEAMAVNSVADMDGAVLYESAVTAGGASEPSPTEEKSSDSGEGGASSQPEVEYRDAETPLALFRPMLATGADGRLELRFTVPNANARWLFQALAWTDDMRIASFDASVVASKPVMVKINAPRFLRQADTATVIASVMNASGTEQTIYATIETFDPLTGKVMASINKHITLSPESSSTISIDAEASPELAMLGIRARATTKTFADGEQTALPILPAATPVIDSEPFYMGPDTEEAIIEMPGAKDASESVTTLEFCENPVWYVVTALPGLSSSDPTTAPQAADAIFSAAVARGLIGRYPAIAEALKEWTAAGADSEALTPMLNKNEDLKNLLLAATPWMMDAQNDAIRMQRLALLFDSKQTERTISAAIALLSRLERQGGGWAWIERLDEPSEWATNSVLSILATLDHYGFTPDDKDLKSMTERALGFIDAKAVELVKKNPDAIMTAYTSLRSAFPGVKASAAAERIMDKATQTVVKDWHSYPVAELPEAAIMLWRRNFKTVAGQILESMRQYMVTTPEKGTFFPSLQNQAWGYLSYTARALDAFATISPSSPEVDGLRHWLVIQKQSTDWGSSAGASEVVTAILASSQSWLTDASGARVKVNGKAIDISATDRRLGYFRIPVKVKNPADNLTVTVDKSGATPAWGAIMRRSVAPLSSVEAASTSDISIEKRITGSETLGLGQKVTVALTIHVNRNLNYVTITDDRAACFEPVSQLPGTQWSEGICFYMEPRDSRTSIFVTTMPKGTYVLTYDVYVNNAGHFASGIATIQSQYAPEITARSAGSVLTVDNPEKK